MHGPLRPKSNTGAFIQPKTLPFGLLTRNLKAFPTPEAFHTLVIDLPALRPKQGRDPAVSVASVRTGQFGHPIDQDLFGERNLGLLALGRPCLAE